MNINVDSVFRMCRSVLTPMKKQGGGVILNIGSISGLVSNIPQPQVAYNASKAAVHMLTKSLASDYADQNIRVNAIAPGYIRTEMTNLPKENEHWYPTWNELTPMNRMAETHEVASAALFLCVGVVYDRMHSRLINTYGGIVSIIPKYSILFMLFTLAALGLPGTSGFVGEFLILMGAFKDNFLVAVIASLGVIIGAAYMLWLYKRVVFGKLINTDLKQMFDLNRSELFILSCLAIPTLFFGFYPDPLINTIEVSISDLIDQYNFKLASKT